MARSASERRDQRAARPASRDLRGLRRLAHYVLPYKWHAIGAAVALVIAATAVLSVGQGLRHLIDGAFAQGRPDALTHALEAMLIVVAVLALSTFARSYLITWLGERVVADLRRDVYAHIVRLSPAFFEMTRIGEVLSRLTADTSVVQTVVGTSITQALRNILLLFGGIGLLLVTNAKLTGLVLVVVPIVVVPIVIIGRRVRRHSRAAQDRLADLAGQGEETLNAIRTVQAFTQEERESARFGVAAEGAFVAATRYARERAMLAGIVIALIFGAIVVVLWIGGNDVLAGRISGGDLSAFVFYAAITASAVGGLSEIMGDLQRAAGATERLFELLETEPLVKNPAEPVPLPLKSHGAIRLEQVDFAYPSQPDNPALADLDLDIRAGETVALVGPSGAGKTSVFQLLMRYYDPSAGRITLDGTSIADLDLTQYRRRLALVPQDAVIFSANAMENIRYGRPEASDAEVRAAAETAGATAFIESLPDGFDTFLGEKGVRLSGGQRQRISIARAILCDPAVLLLDEATSALDAESERFVQAALSRLRRGRTCIVIAHRLATILDADRILVIDRGRVVEQGRHDQLVARGGLYSRLAALQFDTIRAVAS